MRVFPNMAEQPVGHGYSYPTQLNVQEIGSLTLLPLLQILQCCQTLERVLQSQTEPAPQHTWLRNRMATTCVPGQAQPLSQQPAPGAVGLPLTPSSSILKSKTGGHPTHHHGLQAASSSQGPGSVLAWEESMERTCLICFFCAQPMVLPFSMWLQTAQDGH